MSKKGTKRKKTSSAQTEPRSETIVCSDWGSLLETCQSPITARTVGSHKIWLVDGLLSSDECTQLLSRAEGHGFGKTHYEPSYRGNLRLTTKDASLAAAVWARLRPLVPQTLTLSRPDCEAESQALWWHHYPNAEGEWEAYGLNECWRLAKYRAGDRFLPHCDEAYTPQDELLDGAANACMRMSMISVTIYMNSGFDHGKTRFFLRDNWWEQLDGARTDGGGIQYHPKEHGASPDVAVVPVTGRCLLFQQPPGQCYYHDGEEVGSGCKYLFRSDVCCQVSIPGSLGYSLPYTSPVPANPEVLVSRPATTDYVPQAALTQ